MKKLKKILLSSIAITLLLMINTAHAVEQNRLFVEAATAGHEKFMSAMVKNGWANKDRISNQRLAEVAYSQVREWNMIKYAPSSNQSKKKWTSYFRRMYGMTAEYVSVKNFVRKATSRTNGYWVPMDNKHTVSAYQVQSQIAGFEDQLASVQDLVGSQDEKLAVIDGLGDRLDDMSETLAYLGSGNTALKATVETLRKNFESQRAELVVQIDEAVDSRMSGYLWSAMVALVLIFLGIGYVWFRPRVAKELKEMVSKNKRMLVGSDGISKLDRGMVGDISDLKKSVIKLENDSKAYSSSIYTLEKEQEHMGQMVTGYEYDKSLIEHAVLYRLPMKKSIQLKLTSIKDGKEVWLKVEKTGEFQVTVFGALRQPGNNQSVVVDYSESKAINVNRAIDRAAERDCIVGCSDLAAKIAATNTEISVANEVVSIANEKVSEDVIERAMTKIVKV